MTGAMLLLVFVIFIGALGAWLNRPRMYCVALGLMSSYLARPVDAAEFSHESLTGTGFVLSDAGNRTPNFVAREELRLRTGRLQLAVRLDGSAEKAGVDLAEPGTVTTLEGYLLGSYRIVGPLAVSGVYGWTRPSIGVAGPARETWLAGALIGDRNRWLLIGAGKREVVGDDIAAMAAWRVHVAGKTSTTGDVAGIVRDGRLVFQARVNLALSIAGQP